jgi:SAM-dependent methyltransferase
VRLPVTDSGRPTQYRERVLDQIQVLLHTVPKAGIALDFGAGDGWFADRIERLGHARRVIPVEVSVRPGSLKRPVLFDGHRLPFANRVFELTLAIDVLHHCPDPARAIEEALRCTKRYFVLKDHTYRRRVDWLTLAIMDELGNRRFGIHSPHRYQYEWNWNSHFETCGFIRESLIYPAPCHSGIVGRTTNHLQFVALWVRHG